MFEIAPRHQIAVQGLVRIVTGLLFWSHGAQELFGWLGGGDPPALASRFGIAGILEFSGGTLILVGLLTRPVALILAGEMAVAYFWVHLRNASIWPWANRGEVAALYCFVFLLLFLAAGGGRLSVDNAVIRKKDS